MAWAEVDSAYQSLRADCESGADLDRSWRAFADTVQAVEAASAPYHLRGLIAVLERAQDGRPQPEVTVLEHGCGSALTSLYLLALGYIGVGGVDLSGGCPMWNRVLREQFGVQEPRFLVYDGAALPLPDRSVDVVFSEQVLEHVAPAVIDAYYAEEGRVLRPGGLAYHLVPHRMVPYESHTRTWFVHYLPRPLQMAVYRLLGQDTELLEQMLHLRWPGYHRRQLERHIGPYEDRTAARLAMTVDPAYYDASLGLRTLIRRLVTLPLVGAAARSILGNLVMIETIAIKR